MFRSCPSTSFDLSRRVRNRNQYIEPFRHHHWHLPKELEYPNNIVLHLGKHYTVITSRASCWTEKKNLCFPGIFYFSNTTSTLRSTFLLMTSGLRNREQHSQRYIYWSNKRSDSYNVSYVDPEVKRTLKLCKQLLSQSRLLCHLIEYTNL